jgi:hypothetical protein
MGHFVDIGGEVFGRLTVHKVVGRNKHNQLIWSCTCECGSECEALGFLLRRGEKQSCGCLQKEAISKLNYSHGKTRTKIYAIWRAMMQRCYNYNSHAYLRYGGRGITVCDKWKSFECFYADMGDKPEGMSLERKDNSGNYNKDNVIWANDKAQANNRRSNVVLEYNGRKQTMQQWADESGLKIGTIWARLHRGWTVDRAISEAA